MIALFACVALFGWYLWAYRAWHARTGRPGVPSRMVWFGAGCATLAVALSPAMDGAADRSFAWHMGEHLALLYVAPPLLLLGAPLLYLLGTLPRRAARSLARTLHAQPLRTLFGPVPAFLAFVAVLWLSHFSPLYEASLEHPLVHVFEHAAYLGAALLFWSAVVQTGFVPHPVSFPARALYLFLALPQGAFLGAALLQARAPLYAYYLGAMPAAAALADQRDGAALMWIAGGLAIFVAMLVTIGVWAVRERAGRAEAAYA